MLSDPEKRKQYDLYGEEFIRSGCSSGPCSGGSEEMRQRHPDLFNVRVDPEDIFRMFFTEFAAGQGKA